MYWIMVETSEEAVAFSQLAEKTIALIVCSWRTRIMSQAPKLCEVLWASKGDLF
jgi:hypothetical protein